LAKGGERGLGASRSGTRLLSTAVESSSVCPGTSSTQPVERSSASGATTSEVARLVPVLGRPPTDFELLQAIYKRHRDEYANFPESSRATQSAVPIDIPVIARELGADSNSVFGRLYHHPDPLYPTYSPDGKSGKGLFIAQPATANDLIVFPVLEAALAGLWQER